MRIISGLVVLTLVLGLGAGAAQPLTQPQQEFEVASIRINASGEQNYRIRNPPGGRFTASNVSLKAVILEAFDIKDFQLAEHRVGLTVSDMTLTRGSTLLALVK